MDGTSRDIRQRMTQLTQERITVTLSPDQLKTVYAHGRERDNLHAEANSFIDREKTHIKTADVYILCVDDGADIELVGWAWLRDVEATDPTQETGHHTNHVLKPSDLRTMPKPQQVDPRDNER